jgi:hypothetical protein
MEVRILVWKNYKNYIYSYFQELRSSAIQCQDDTPTKTYIFMFCRGEGSAAGLQLRVRFAPAALLAMLGTAVALQCVSKARDWTGHEDG